MKISTDDRSEIACVNDTCCQAGEREIGQAADKREAPRGGRVSGNGIPWKRGEETHRQFAQQQEDQRPAEQPLMQESPPHALRRTSHVT